MVQSSYNTVLAEIGRKTCPMFLHLDCQHYLGDRPCKFQRLCEGCPHYAPMGPRVLIIKLGALGDVVRTACLLPGLAAQAEAPHVTWLTSPAARPLVERMSGVDRVLIFSPEALAHLAVERFDTILSLDKEAAPCSVAMTTRADQRLGMGLSRYGTVFPLNDECDDYFTLGLDNEAKFHQNQKTYPELIYGALGMSYTGQSYTLTPTEADRRAATDRLAEIDVFADDKMCWVGINPGAGRVFANKGWREDGYIELIRELSQRRADVRFLLLGGADEEALIERISLATGDAPVYRAGCNHSLGTFAALIEHCAVVVSGDTLAMHLALATGGRSVAIFGPTCAQEIDMFGRGIKLVSPIDCAPCYRRQCDKSSNCQDLITTEQVLKAVLEQLDATAAERTL